MGISESSCIGVVLVCVYVCEYIGTCVHTIKQIPSPLLQSLLVLIYMYHHIYQGSSQKKKKRIAFSLIYYLKFGDTSIWGVADPPLDQPGTILVYMY